MNDYEPGELEPGLAAAGKKVCLSHCQLEVKESELKASHSLLYPSQRELNASQNTFKVLASTFYFSQSRLQSSQSILHPSQREMKASQSQSKVLAGTFYSSQRQLNDSQSELNGQKSHFSCRKSYKTYKKRNIGWIESILAEGEMIVFTVFMNDIKKSQLENWNDKSAGVGRLPSEKIKKEGVIYD